MVPLLYLVSPLLLTLVTTFATMAALGRRRPLPARVPLWLLLADLSILALAWLLVRTAPDLTTSNGVCKDLSDFDAFYLLVYGSAVAGGAAWGAASLQPDSRAVRLLGYAGVALVVPYVVAVHAFFASACGWN